MMPEITSCPQCSRKLRIPDDLMGKRVKCPGCGLNFTAAPEGAAAPPPPAHYQASYNPPAVPAPPPMPPMPTPPGMAPGGERAYDDRGPRRDHDDYDDRPRRAPGSQTGWRAVRTGIILTLISFLCFVIAGGVLFMALVLTEGFRPRGYGRDNEAIGVLAVGCVGLLGLGGRIMQIVAYGFYMNVPSRTEARGLASTCLGASIGGIIVSVIGYGMVAMVASSGARAMNPFETIAGAGIIAIVVNGLVVLLWLTETACVLFFHKAAATTLRADGIAQSITFQLILGGVVVLLYLGLLGMTFVMFNAAISRPTAYSGNADAFGVMLGACGCLTAVLAVGWGIWYIVTHFLMLGVVNGAIRRY
jgi:hypothetical protein